MDIRVGVGMVLCSLGEQYRFYTHRRASSRWSYGRCIHIHIHIESLAPSHSSYFDESGPCTHNIVGFVPSISRRSRLCTSSVQRQALASMLVGNFHGNIHKLLIAELDRSVK